MAACFGLEFEYCFVSFTLVGIELTVDYKFSQKYYKFHQMQQNCSQ